MFGFILKKNFCDGWDNLFSVVISNLVFLFSAIALVLLNGLAARTESEIVVLLVLVFSLVFLSILIFAYSDTAAHIANFDGIHLMDFFKSIPGAIKDGALFGLMNDAAMNIHVQGICVTLFSVLLSKFLGIEWLGHRVTLGLTF